MKWKLIFFSLLVEFIITCKNIKNETLLQKDEVSFANLLSDSISFQFPSSSEGMITMESYIGKGIDGEILLKADFNIAIKYPFSTNNNFYPLQFDTTAWQKISLKWNLNNSSLNVFINDKLQTIRLVNSEEIKSIDKITIITTSSNKNLKIRNISYSGKLMQLSRRLKIVAFGNSTTAIRSTVTGVYAQRIPELLLKERIPNIVFNEGVPGSHTGHLTDNDRHRVKHALDRFETNVLSHNPDITIVSLGINDSWIDDEMEDPRIPLDSFEQNLRFIIISLISKGSKVILMTPSALGKEYEKWRYDNTEKYVGVIRKLSSEFQTSLIDQWAVFEKMSASGENIDNFLLDGMHPNDRWHKILAELLVKEIIKMTK